jgi:cobalt-precorrin 5A hydrolase/precorrin-3B C17-methyltransferase
MQGLKDHARRRSTSRGLPGPLATRQYAASRGACRSRFRKGEKRHSPAGTARARDFPRFPGALRDRNMTDLPQGCAIVAFGRSGLALGRRLRAGLPGALLHGPRAHPGDWDATYERAVPHIAALFAAERPIIGIGAGGILIRAVAPLLAGKNAEPPLVAVAEDGSAAVPLLGGHHGANRLARAIAALTGGVAAITTAGDLRLGLALDEPPSGWRIADPERAKGVVAALLAGEGVALVEEAGGGAWLRASGVDWQEGGGKRVVVTDRAIPPDADTLVFHPPVLALGIGCERGVATGEIAELAQAALAAAGLAPAAVAAVVSLELKRAEPGIHALAASFGVPARFFPAARLLAETDRLSARSQAAFRATGCWGVAEGAALAAVGADGALVVPKRRSRRATCAVARAVRPIAAETIGRARGSLAIVGIGPGDPSWRTPEASEALAAASDIVGYGLYLDLLGPAIAGKTRHESALGAEAERARLALDLAAEGREVALVSSGDAGIYGLAALVFELIDRAPKAEWAAIAMRVCPGVSALQAASACAGAPLGHDFCAISLSDLLTPAETIRARLEAAAAADFVVALYNPRSARRPALLAEAAAILLRHRPPDTPVVLARNLGRAGESVRTVALGDLGRAAVNAEIDMLTVVLVGSRRTRRLAADPRLVYTPRGYFDREGE